MFQSMRFCPSLRIRTPQSESTTSLRWAIKPYPGTLSPSVHHRYAKWNSLTLLKIPRIRRSVAIAWPKLKSPSWRPISLLTVTGASKRHTNWPLRSASSTEESTNGTMTAWEKATSKSKYSNKSRLSGVASAAQQLLAQKTLRSVRLSIRLLIKSRLMLTKTKLFTFALLQVTIENKIAQTPLETKNGSVTQSTGCPNRQSSRTRRTSSRLDKSERVGS